MTITLRFRKYYLHHVVYEEIQGNKDITISKTDLYLLQKVDEKSINYVVADKRLKKSIRKVFRSI